MPRPRMIAAAALAALVLLTQQSAANAAHATQAEPAQDVSAALSNPNLSPGLRQRLSLFKLINEQRAAHGLPRYKLDARLMASANEHSADMATSRRCRHTGSDGSSSRARMKRHGYPYNNWAGENIICGRPTPERAMQWWLSSGPHRRNILHGHYTHIGVGYHPDGPYGPMWTLNFAAGSPTTAQPAVFTAESGLPDGGEPPSTTN